MTSLEVATGGPYLHCSPIVGGLNPGGVVYGFGISDGMSSSSLDTCLKRIFVHLMEDEIKKVISDKSLALQELWRP